MNRKRREANARRAMAAGRRRGSASSEGLEVNLLQDEGEVALGSIEAPLEANDVRATRPGGA